MQLRQIQEDVAECLQYISIIEKERQQKEREKQQTEELRFRIKQTRIQITRLHYDLKHSKASNHNKRQYFKIVDNLQKQIKMTTILNNKCQEQFKQMMNVCSKTRKKLRAVEDKIQKTQHQLDQCLTYEKYEDVYKQLQQKYWSLRTQFESVMINTKEQDEKYLTLLTQRKRQVIEKDTMLTKITEKYKDFDEKVRIQKELIESILKIQNPQQNNSKVHQFQPQENKDQAQVPKQMITKDLDPLQRVEIENIILKKQYRNQQEASLDRILHQRHNTQFVGRIVNLRNRGNYNLSAVTNVKSSKTQPVQSYIYPTVLPFITSEQRSLDLQKRKRIRTRQTQMHKFSQQYKNIGSQDFANSLTRKKPENGILQVYEKLKQQKKPFNKRVSGNIEIIKLLKKRNKKKRGQAQRGSLVQPQPNSV